MATLSDSMKNRVLQTLKTFFHYCIAYGDQTWQDGDLPGDSPAHKITWPFDDVVLLDHVTN